MSCSCSSGMSNSYKSRWKLTVQTMIRVRINFVQHTQRSKMTSMTQRQKTLMKAEPACPPNASGAREAEDGIQQQPPTSENNSQGLGGQMQKQHEATQRCSQRHASPTSKYQFFERHERQYHEMVAFALCSATSFWVFHFFSAWGWM